MVVHCFSNLHILLDTLLTVSTILDPNLRMGGSWKSSRSSADRTFWAKDTDRTIRLPILDPLVRRHRPSSNCFTELV